MSVFFRHKVVDNIVYVLYMLCGHNSVRVQTLIMAWIWGTLREGPLTQKHVFLGMKTGAPDWDQEDLNQ